MNNQVQQRSVNFTSSGVSSLRLEGVLHAVGGDGQLPAAVICHPHPLGGGSMHNSVVVAIAHALVVLGVSALRFNFRGVGASEGIHDHGLGERDDVAGALDWLRAQPGVAPGCVSLIGYSFGACVALAQAYADPSVSAFAAVGLAVEFCAPDFVNQLAKDDQVLSDSALGSSSCPKLFVTGERDRLAPPGELIKFVERLSAPRTVQIVPGADHFWWGSESRVGDLVADFVARL